MPQLTDIEQHEIKHYGLNSNGGGCGGGRTNAEWKRKEYEKYLTRLEEDEEFRISEEKYNEEIKKKEEQGYYED